MTPAEHPASSTALRLRQEKEMRGWKIFYFPKVVLKMIQDVALVKRIL